MKLFELIKMRGFDCSSKVKLVRHQDSRYDVPMLYKNGFFDIYQSLQSKNVFGNCDYILSFIGDEGTKATYIGAYKKCSTQKLDKSRIPDDYPYINDEKYDDNYYFYEFEKIELLSDLVDRLIIEWGKSTRSWYQWLDEKKDKEIVEILPEGYTRDFPGFDELLLSFSELEKIVKNNDANRIWHTMLGSVAGVYLIVDRSTGFQYVGSAYGEEGIFGRWKTYVGNRHGGNKILIELLNAYPNRYKDFQFSILQTLPRSMNKDLVIQKEQVYKAKLGTRAYGLNGN